MDDEILRLLGDGDPEEAENRYRYLFAFFCRFFEWRGCRDPEGLTQTVFQRGIERLRSGSQVQESGIGGFLYGFAQNLLKEDRKAQKTIPWDGQESPGPVQVSRLNTGEHARLINQYLDCLTDDERTLLLGYIDGKRAAPGESAEALRIKIFRIRRKLESLEAKPNDD